jgi:yecA family protein
VSSLSRRYRSAVPDAGELVPPNLRTVGAPPFGDPQRARLTAWLREAAWPRGHMDIVELEGYLVALIVWPLAISAGAWLPPVWGGRGWRVPAKIATRARYEEFVSLVVGYMRDLDRRLCDAARFELSVLHDLKDDARVEARHRWGRGFMLALTLGSQGLKCRNTCAGDAVRTIARNTSASATFAAGVDSEIAGAVIALTAQRASRGPLGPLEDAPAPAVGSMERSRSGKS